MIRTTVFFDEVSRACLRNLARRSGAIQAQMLREAIPQDDVSVAPQELAPGIGEFRSANSRTGWRTREFLAKAAKDDARRRS